MIQIERKMFSIYGNMFLDISDSATTKLYFSGRKTMFDSRKQLVLSITLLVAFFILTSCTNSKSSQLREESHLTDPSYDSLSKSDTAENIQQKSDNNTSVSDGPSEESNEFSISKAISDASRRIEYDGISNLDGYMKYVNDSLASETLEVPIYYEDDILFNNNRSFELNNDAAWTIGLSGNWPNYPGLILYCYPTSAIRQRDDGCIYFMYETDTGYRLYLFFLKDFDGLRLRGYPILIKNILSSKDFASIKVGDPISKVEAIDPVATLHKRQLVNIWHIDPETSKHNSDNGHPCTSLHYLSDGLLKIDYEMLDTGDFLVSNISIHKDYVITDLIGEKISHYILENDLPSKD
ncbi:MAG: hypothetical protein J6T40_05490 [Clostridiales bacterium]|nr:hypothetical protein [Clostridiales bacterium]